MIKKFDEKGNWQEGFINRGVCCLNAGKFLNEPVPAKFSFDKKFLETYFEKRRMHGFIQDKYFIDIGIPEDFDLAQSELKNFHLQT